MDSDEGATGDLEYDILDVVTEDEYALFELVPDAGPLTRPNSAEAIGATRAVILDLYQRGLVTIGFRAGPTVHSAPLPPDAVLFALADPVWWNATQEAAIVVFVTEAGVAEYERQALLRFGAPEGT